MYSIKSTWRIQLSPHPYFRVNRVIMNAKIKRIIISICLQTNIVSNIPKKSHQATYVILVVSHTGFTRDYGSIIKHVVRKSIIPYV
jgi:hypothetical protein